jgi:homoserine trans-succinylase
MKNGVCPRKNMKKTIPNPEYSKAEYTLGWVVTGKIGAGAPVERFKIKPPASWKSIKEMDDWIKKNAIYPTIEVDE